MNPESSQPGDPTDPMSLHDSIGEFNDRAASGDLQPTSEEIARVREVALVDAEHEVLGLEEAHEDLVARQVSGEDIEPDILSDKRAELIEAKRRLDQLQGNISRQEPDLTFATVEQVYDMLKNVEQLLEELKARDQTRAIVIEQREHLTDRAQLLRDKIKELSQHTEGTNPE